MDIADRWAELVERVHAASPDRRFWAGAWTLTAALAIAMGVGFLPWAWVVPGIAIGLLTTVGSAGHELYRRPWGTWMLLAFLTIVAGAGIVLLATGVQRWSLAGILGPALCLIGMIVLWRDRPRGEQGYLVPAQAARLLARIEGDLRRIEPATPFHAVIGRSLLDQTDAAADWLSGAYDLCVAEAPVTAMYVEMVRIEINPDQWSLAVFGFTMPAGELLDDLYMNLGEYEQVPEEEFVLTGMADLQAAYEQTDIGDLMVSQAPADQRLLEAASIAADLITARMWELVAAAHRQAAARGHPVGGIRVLANMHDSPVLPLLVPPSGRVRR
jgi:hypothetical protein